MRVQREVVLGVGTDVAWELVSDPEELAAWLGDLGDAPITAGARRTLVERDGTVRHLVVDDVVEGARVGFTWWTDDDAADATHVELAVEEHQDGSRVTVTEVRASVGATSVARLAVGGGWAGRLVDLGVRSLLRDADRALV